MPASKYKLERIAEAVALFGISRDTIYRLIRKGCLPAVNLAERLTRISYAHIKSMFSLVEQKQQTTPTCKTFETF